MFSAWFVLKTCHFRFTKLPLRYRLCEQKFQIEIKILKVDLDVEGEVKVSPSHI